MYCQHVFSTYVEVILLNSTNFNVIPGILHVCGGDPNDLNFKKYNGEYSPRMWR